MRLQRFEGPEAGSAVLAQGLLILVRVRGVQLTVTITSQQTIGEFHDSGQPPAPDTAALHIRGLSKIFSKGKTIALQDIDLDIHPGEMVCLITPEFMSEAA